MTDPVADDPTVPLAPFSPQPRTHQPPSARTPWRDGDRSVYTSLVYSYVEGWRPQEMDLYLPDRGPSGGPGQGPTPVVVYVHGGAWRGGSHTPGWDPYVDFAVLWRMLNDAGIAVASISYRHSAEATYPACLHDVKAAIRWLRRYASELGLDPDRIGLVGDSAGGHLVSLAAQPGSDEGDAGVTGVASDVRALVAWYPVTSLADMPGRGPQAGHVQLLGGTPEELPELARDASPVSHVGPQSPPALLLHGLADQLVPYHQSELLAEAYRSAGAEVELELVPRGNHCFLGLPHEPFFERTVEFLARHLS